MQPKLLIDSLIPICRAAQLDPGPGDFRTRANALADLVLALVDPPLDWTAADLAEAKVTATKLKDFVAAL